MGKITRRELSEGVRSELDKGKEALEQKLNNYEIQKNGTDGPGIINFKTT